MLTGYVAPVAMALTRRTAVDFEDNLAEAYACLSVARDFCIRLGSGKLCCNARMSASTVDICQPVLRVFMQAWPDRDGAMFDEAASTGDSCRTRTPNAETRPQRSGFNPYLHIPS